jgi:Sigma-70 region 2
VPGGTGQGLVEALVASHGAQLRRYLISRVRNSADVPALVQEVFLRMLRIPDHDAVRSPEAYLFTVAQHVAHQHAIRRSNSTLSARERATFLYHRPDGLTLQAKLCATKPPPVA